MTDSADTRMNITPELAAAVAKLQGILPEITRDRTVEVETKGDKANYGYSYATLANVTKQIMPKLSECGLSYSAFPGACSDGKMGLRYYLMHESGGFIVGEFALSAEGGIQTLGGRITYARRYCLLAVTGLAADEDDDAAAAQAEDEANGPTAQRNRPRSAPRAAGAATGRARRPDSRPTQQQGGAAAAPPEETDMPEPRDPSAPISGPQQQKLILQFRDLGVDDREFRLKVVSSLVQRPIETQKDLTMGEAHNLINWIGEALKTDEPMDTLRSTAKAAHERALVEGPGDPTAGEAP